MTEISLHAGKPPSTLELRTLKSMQGFVAAPPTLYLYTDIAGATRLCMRRALWLDRIPERAARAELRNAIELFRAQLARRGRATEGGFLDRCSGQLDRLAELNLCVATFSEDGDLDAHWQRGAGLALGFKGAALKAFEHYERVCLCRCIYDEAAQYQVIAELIERAQSVSTHPNVDSGRLLHAFSTLFAQVAAVMRPPQAATQREWRLLAVPLDYRLRHYDVRAQGNDLVEYYALAFPPREDRVDVLARIVVGPHADARRVAHALRVLLYKQRYDVDEIACSGAKPTH